MFDIYVFQQLYAPKDIFQYVCDCIGEHYKEQGMRYAKSSHKLSWKLQKLKCSISFYSSHSNTPGQNVLLEIHPSVAAIRHEDMKRKGVLMFPLFYLREPDGLKDRAIIHFDGSVTHHELLNPGDAPELIWSNKGNLHNLDQKGFQDIISYTDAVISVLNKLETKEGIQDYLHLISVKRHQYALNDEDTKRYIEQICSEQ